MIGYPKRIGCEQDLLNLMDDYPDEVKRDLERIKAYDAEHANVLRVVSGSEETGDLVTETIANPFPMAKQFGITDIDALISAVDAKLSP